MGESSLINLGNLSKPATVLIEKIFDAIGGYYKPYQIKRVAKAEAEAEIIKTHANIEITELQHRALTRFITEESTKQNNIETITLKAIPELKDTSNPDNLENDWITNFFDKCRNISDNEMQTLWAKILAGEANTPGTYSKRTVNLLESLDKTDASIFTSLCCFCWHIKDIDPLIYNENDPIYNDKGINFETLTHLDDIGLVSFNITSHYSLRNLPKIITIEYFGRPLYIEFQKESSNQLNVGKVMLTKTGQQLAYICSAKPVKNFQNYITEKLTNSVLTVNLPEDK